MITNLLIACKELGLPDLMVLRFLTSLEVGSSEETIRQYDAESLMEDFLSWVHQKA